MKLNLGCGQYPLKGYVNIDSHSELADHKGDFREMNFRGADEVRMEHVLEHLPWQEIVQTLERIRSWMRPGAELVVEVPDMRVIMREGDRDPNWILYIYGSQEHEGEYHQSGFTEHALRKAFQQAGFSKVTAKTFRSTNPVRVGMPCLEVIGAA